MQTANFISFAALPPLLLHSEPDYHDGSPMAKEILVTLNTAKVTFSLFCVP